MSDIYLTADEHYGHKNIIEYCKRPFTSVEEMTETMIEKHNKKVPNNSNIVTIHVGDLFWRTLGDDVAHEIIGRLHGRHAFIYGNHDELIQESRTLRDRFNWVKGENKASGVHIIHYDKHEITLCHYAMRVWSKSHKGSWMLYGHSHNELPVVGKSFDIGVDGHNFEPWSLEEIAVEMEKRPLGHVITNVWTGKEVCRNCGSPKSDHSPTTLRCPKGHWDWAETTWMKK